MFTTDKSLDQLIRLARKGEYDGRIWVVVDGCMISGRLTRWANFKDVISPDWVFTNIEDELQKEALPGVGMPINTLELMDVWIDGEQKTWARIVINRVSAWGMEG